MKRFNIIVCVTLITHALFSQTMTDINGNVYKTVQIGTQTWMAENLRTTKYNDGVLIPNLLKKSEWKKAEAGAYCTYRNTCDTAVINKYGMLYNGYAVSRGNLCPEGWHVPDNAEWTILETYLSKQFSDTTIKQYKEKRFYTYSDIYDISGKVKVVYMPPASDEEQHKGKYSVTGNTIWVVLSDEDTYRFDYQIESDIKLLGGIVGIKGEKTVDMTVTNMRYGKTLASTSGWKYSSGAETVGNNQALNNQSGFNAFPGGYRAFWSGQNFSNFGYTALWWSSEKSSNNYWTLRYYDKYIGNYSGSKQYGFSVRCVKD